MLTRVLDPALVYTLKKSINLNKNKAIFETERSEVLLWKLLKCSIYICIKIFSGNIHETGKFKR